ncbi:sulfotransferase [Pseudoscourfieldia marina]
MAYDDDSYYYDSYDESPESYYTHKKGYGYDAYYPKFSVWKPWTWKYKKYDAAYDYDEHMPDSLYEMPMAEAESSPAVAVASEASLESAPTTSRAREHFANRDGDWFDEGDDDDDDYPPPSSVPFIHIPKTGGTSIEDTFHSLGIKAGRFAFDEDDNFLPYSTMSVPCSKWHKPPRSYVNGSFYVSTFLWAHYDITKNQRTISNASPHCLHDHEEDDLCKTTKKFILEEWYKSDHELFLNMTN